MIKKSINCPLKMLELPECIKNALASIEKIDFSSLKEGKYMLEDGSKLIFSRYETQPFENKVLIEGHKKFIDIQIVFEGEETIGVLSADQIQDKSEYDETNDVWTAEIVAERLEFVDLKKNDFLVLFPMDAHAPQLAGGKEPVLVKKGVIKVPFS